VHPGGKVLVTFDPVEPSGPMIIDGRGRLIWFDQVPAPDVAANLRIQQYRGRPVLTWWQGPVAVDAYGLGQGMIASGSGGSLHQIAEVPDRSFDTRIEASSSSSKFVVRALGAGGTVLASSRAVAAAG
jgi:hypothetical protein